MKRMYGTIVILLLVLTYAFFQESNPKKMDKNRTPIVGILQLTDHPALNEIHKGIIDGLKESGYIPNKNIKIDFQNAEGDQSNLQTMSTKFANENVDAAIGIATPAAQSLANTIKNAPIVLGAITDPQKAGLVDSNQHPGRNVTGVSDLLPLQPNLDLIKASVPHLKNLGIIYTSSDNSSTTQYQMFKKLCKQNHINLKAYTIANSNDLNQVSQQMLQKVDAVFVPVDNTIASSIQTLIANANAKNIPVFPGSDTMVKAGGVATYTVDQYGMGVQTGKITAGILRGQIDPKNTPIDFTKHPKLVINLQQIRKLGIHLPENIIEEAKHKGVIYK
ncbi:tryptophan ABC transporter substrate-binding protein [Apilactobacillus xinyiensis]|uniref:ABC transporter substrate-binding protein n=1 Tax=Apilactobacillus xinyiensis TaxID=2841032 RepID=A0ABT0I0S7_9LACO|nr:tryptophan ABC transporter substrate-binding protein [Apilactobacillus xinyiensis]MCK8624403.1 ABC transporter substrate-binding protein [Apilactobacillus xinyiensis]MCL0318730.1 ABC transporter substrate-binding protein [Apilactobacillus xinyiensis]